MSDPALVAEHLRSWGYEPGDVGIATPEPDHGSAVKAWGDMSEAEKSAEAIEMSRSGIDPGEYVAALDAEAGIGDDGDDG